MNYLEIAHRNQQRGREILEQTDIIPTWEKIGASVYVVGSLQTGLLMKNLDIDLHIYTDILSVADSFLVMQELAEKMPLKEIQYKNLIETEEECIEWHAWYDTPYGDCWKFDMIHIRKGSKYDGVIEGVTEGIMQRLTPEIRSNILKIKYDIPDKIHMQGIEIYHAVLDGGVRNYEELLQWRKKISFTDTLKWAP